MLSDHDLREAFTAVRVRAEERATPPPLRTVLGRTGRRLTPAAVVAAIGVVLAGSWTTVGLLSAASPAGSMTVTVWLQQGSNCVLVSPVSRTVATTGPQESKIDAAIRAVLDGVTPAEAAAGYASPFSAQVLAIATVTVTPPASVKIDLASIAPLEAIPLVCRSSVLNAVNQTAISAGVLLPITWTIAGYPAPIALWLAGA